jgi:ribosomal 30S subunit maturation factor RimM
VNHGDRFDPAALFGCRVVDDSGHRLGRVAALVHRGDGCDVLVDRRRWLRHTVLRMDLEDLVPVGRGCYRQVRPQRLSTGPSDDRVA